MCRWIVLALALACIGQVLANKSAVEFHSKNFRHKLHWPRVEESTAGPVRYSVQYKIYGEEWKNKRECQNITALSCDLTEEMSDIRNHYYAKVMANGVEVGLTSRFLPLRDTVLGAPDVAITRGVRSLKLSATLPLGPYGRQSLADFMLPDPIIYKANLTYNNKTHKIVIIEMTTKSSEILFERLQSNTEYNVSVCYVLPVSKHSEAFHRVVNTLAIPERQGLFIIPAMLAVFILLSSFLLFCQIFVHRKSRTPHALKIDLKKSDSPLVFHFPGESITTPKVYTRVPGKLVDKKPLLVHKTSGDSYAPQVCDPDEQSWHCQSYMGQQGEPDLQPNSRQSSINYSLVSVLPTNEDGMRKLDNPTPLGTSLCQGQLLKEEDRVSSEDPGTLVLPAVRRSNGKLEVSSFFSLLQVPEQESEEVPDMAAVGEASSVDEVTAEKVGRTSYLANQSLSTSYASQQVCSPVPAPDWNIPLEGHAPSAYRGNGQEVVTLLPLSQQEVEPSAGGSTGGMCQYLSQVFSDTWGLHIQES